MPSSAKAHVEEVEKQLYGGSELWQVRAHAVLRYAFGRLEEGRGRGKGQSTPRRSWQGTACTQWRTAPYRPTRFRHPPGYRIRCQCDPTRLHRRQQRQQRVAAGGEQRRVRGGLRVPAHRPPPYTDSLSPPTNADEHRRIPIHSAHRRTPPHTDAAMRWAGTAWH